MIHCTVGNNLSRYTVPFVESTTLREAFAQQGIDYTHGVVSLNGSSIRPTDIDKTFADFGISGNCSLISVVKTDNAAKVKIAGRACIIESDIKLDDLRMVRKYRPDYLALYEYVDGNKQLVYGVGLSDGSGSIDKFGIVFGANKSADGKAMLTFIVDDSVDDVKLWVEENIGAFILKLNEIELGIADAIADIERDKHKIAELITVL